MAKGQESDLAQPQPLEAEKAKGGDKLRAELPESGKPEASGLEPGQGQKRREATASLVKAGTIPGLALDFGSHDFAAQPGRGPFTTAESSFHSNQKAASGEKGDGQDTAREGAKDGVKGGERQPISADEAKFVAGLVRGLDSKAIDYDTFSGETSAKPAAAKDVAALARAYAVLGKDDIEKVNAAFGGNTLEALRANPHLSPNDKEKLEIYGQGIEKRQTDPALTLKLADLAVQSHNINDFTLAFSGAGEQARQAFLQNSDNNPNLGQKAIDTAFSKTDGVTASEFVRHGKTTAETEISRETGSLTTLSFSNYDGVERTLKSLSPEQSQSYARGAELAKSGTTTSLNDAADLAKFRALDGALQNAAGNNNVRLEYWRALAANNGQSSNFLDSVTGEGGRFYNGTLAGKLTGANTDHLKESWDKHSYDFYNNPELGAQRRESTRNVLSAFKDGDKLVAQFDKQVSAPSYEESARLAGKTQPGPDHKSLPALSNAVIVGGDGTVIIDSTAKTLRGVEQELRQDGELKERIGNPKTAEDIAIRDNLRGKASEVFGSNSDAYKQYLELEKGRTLSPETWAKLDKAEGDRSHKGFFADLDRQSQSERDQIAADPTRKEAVLGHLDQNYRQVAEQVLAHGLTSADRLQLARLNGDNKGAVEAIEQGAKENLHQFRKQFESTYGKSLDEAARQSASGQKSIDIERALAGDKSAIGQFQTDLRIKSELHAPVLDGIAATLGSNTPRREAASFDAYTAAVGRRTNNTGDSATTGDELDRARQQYRGDRDALNKTEKQVVQTSSAIAVTAIGAAVTGGAGWGALALNAADKGARAVQIGTLTASTIGTPIARHEALGRLHDGQASTYVRDGVDGLAGTFLGGSNLPGLGFKRAPEWLEKAGNASVTKALEDGSLVLKSGQTVKQAVGDSNLLTSYGHVAYPFISNASFATINGLADGKRLDEAVLSGIGTGALAATGVGSGWVISRGSRAFGPQALAEKANQIIQNKPLSTALHRAGGGGTGKGLGKEGEYKAPHGKHTGANPWHLPGTVLEF